MFELAKELLQLFKASFAENCQLDEASMTSEEVRTLDFLDEEELLENLKRLLTSLLKFKQEHCTTPKHELIQRATLLEQLLQKLEAEVRKHVKLENQLKLQLENSQNRLEELETNKPCQCSAQLAEAAANVAKLQTALAEAQKQVERLQEELARRPIEPLRRRTGHSPPGEFMKKRMSDQNLPPAQLMPKRVRQSIVITRERLKKQSPDTRQASPYFAKGELTKPLRSSVREHTRSLSDYRTSLHKRVPAV